MSQFLPKEFSSDRWADNCRRKLYIVDTRRAKTTVAIPPELHGKQKSVYERWPALRYLAAKLTDHS
jgi:hypothetical protein